MSNFNSVTPDHSATQKWGDASKAGFQILPDVLLRNQKKLGMNANDLVVLTNILMHWWYQSKKPFIGSQKIAARMGTSVRTVQRSISNLQALGLVAKEREMRDDGEYYTVYNLDGLVAAVEKITASDPIFRKKRMI